MVDAIQPQHLSLIDLLNKRLFTIPDYQRSYSWSERQRRDLFNDIKSLREQSDDAGHFMATVVCLRRTTVQLGTDVMTKLDIVDGQQRLTTLVILFNAIRFALDKENQDEKRSVDELEVLLVKPHGDNLLLLQTNHDSSHFFANYLRKGTAPSPDTAKTLADRDLLSAIAECRRFVDDWVEKGDSLLDLAALIKNKLTFILHEISEEKTVYTVFEVLNSRGIEVAWLDRLKSVLMGKAFLLEEEETRKRLIGELHTLWRDIYSIIGLRQGLNTEALRFAATLHACKRLSKPLSEQDAVDTLRAQAGDAKSIREVAQWLFEITKACHAVKSNPRQDAVTRITQARLLAVALHATKFNEKEKDGLLAIWEKVTFRIYGLYGYDARTGVGDYCQLAWEVANGKETKISAKKTRERILEMGSDYPIADGIEYRRGANCYETWKDELRYFLFRYEEHLARKKGQKADNHHWEHVWAKHADLSIEHIRPQNEAPEDIKHTLGNLMLLPPGRNSQLGDRRPKDKAESYIETGFYHAREVAGMLEKSPSWSRQACKERESELLKWALDEWAD